MSAEQEKNVLLASVSRSFYLTIRALPKPLRHPIRTAYLLARATDTIADTANVPLEVRLNHLRSLRQIILGKLPHEESMKIGLVFSPQQTVPAERILLTHLPEILSDYDLLEPADREDVRWVLEQITEGQELDLLTPRLTTNAELERYTWLVAGCVGEFWTRLGVRKLPGYARLSNEEMLTLGADFGKGLQLINILRDLPEDLANARSYLPHLEDYATWKMRAERLMENGWKYVSALRQWRLRFACALPVLIGVRTLALLGTTPPQKKIKVSRKEIRSILIQTAWRGLAGRWLDAYWRRLKG